MIDTFRLSLLCLLALLASSSACGSSTASGGGKGDKAKRGEVEEVTLYMKKDAIEGRECVPVGRVTSRADEVEEDLKEQTKDLGGNVVVVNQYSYKRMHLGYAVKGVAHFCY